jgi:hypothetical protein
MELAEKLRKTEGAIDLNSLSISKTRYFNPLAWKPIAPKIVWME